MSLQITVSGVVAPDNSNLRQTLDRRADGAERRAEAGADCLHASDDEHGNKSSDEAVFNRGNAALVITKILQNGKHAILLMSDKAIQGSRAFTQAQTGGHNLFLRNINVGQANHK